MSDAADVGSVGVQPDSPMIAPPSGDRRRMSEMGSEGTQNLRGMQRIDVPQGAEVPQGEAIEQMQPLLEDPNAAPVEEMAPLEQDQAQDPNAPTPEQLVAEYKAFQDDPNFDLEKYGDKVIWYDADGKGDMRPIRARDVPNNILMYNDYQRKTTEIAEFKRQYEAKENGRKQLIADCVGEDTTLALRAWRAMIPEQHLEKMALAYYKERAELESLPLATQQRLLAQQKLEDENFYLKRRTERAEQMAQQRAQQEQQQQGTAAPDITFVQQHIVDTLPSVFQQLGIAEAEAAPGSALHYELERQFARAAAGERNADGTWRVAPIIRRGQAPSRQVIQQIVVGSKQQVDKLFASPHAKRIAPPRRVAPASNFGGTGPAAQPGKAGNISAPQRQRWSDMDAPMRRQ